MPDGRVRLSMEITQEMLKHDRFPSPVWYEMRFQDDQSLTTPGKASHRLLRSLQVLLDHGVLDECLQWELGDLCHDAAEGMVLHSARKGHLQALKFFLGMPWETGTVHDDWKRRYPDAGFGRRADEPLRWPERDLTGLAKRAFAAAAAGGHLVCLKFMHTHFLTQEERFQALKEQGRGPGDIYAVKKSSKDDIPWDASATEAAVAHEQLLALTFLWAHDCPWSDATRKRAAELGFAPAAQKQLWYPV